MPDLTYRQYVDNRTQYWQQIGFQALPSDNSDLMFRRRKFSITKFGIVDTFCIVTHMKNEVTTGFISEFGSDAFKIALKNKFFLPRGLGAMAVVYPLIVANQVPETVANFLTQSHTPKHYASVEFPVIFDLSTQHLIFYQGTPVWGAAYYSGYRKEVQHLFAYQK
jgi:hypothetical protein